MKSGTESKFVPGSDQTDSLGREKMPTFQVQTGVRAGGFYEDFYSNWQNTASSANAADRATGAGRWA